MRTTKEGQFSSNLQLEGDRQVKLMQKVSIHMKFQCCIEFYNWLERSCADCETEKRISIASKTHQKLLLTFADNTYYETLSYHGCHLWSFPRSSLNQTLSPFRLGLEERGLNDKT